MCSTCSWGGVHDVYTRRLVTVNYSLYTHFLYLCLNLYVYLYLRSFLDILLAVLNASNFSLLYVTQMRLTFVQ